MTTLWMLLASWSCLSWAQTTTTFSRAELEQGVVELYSLFPRENRISSSDFQDLPAWIQSPASLGVEVCFAPSRLTPVDAAVQDAHYLATIVATLDTRLYNDLIAHALVDYRQNPTHRPALRVLLQDVGTQAAGRIQAARIRQRAPYLRMLDDVAIALEWAYAFAFGHGVWSAGQRIAAGARMGARPLTNLEIFRLVVREVAHSTRLRQPLTLAALGVGTTIGAVDAYLIPMLINGFEQVPLDPEQLITETDSELARRLAEQTVAFRDRVCGLPRIRILPASEARELSQEIYSILVERSYLEAAAPYTLHTLRGTDEIRRAAMRCMRELEAEGPDLRRPALP